MKVRVAAGILATLAALQLPFAAAAPAMQAARPLAAELEQARRLAELTNPSELMLELNLAGWEISVRESMASNPNTSELEARYPGLSDAVVEATRPLARHHSAKFVRETNERRSALYAERLNAAEIAEVIAFYETEIGRKLIRDVLGNTDFTGLGRDLVRQRRETGKASISAEAVKRAEAAALQRVAPRISADEETAIAKFAQRPAAVKFMAARDEMERRILALVNNPDPEWLREQGKQAQGAVLAFIGRVRK